MHVTRAGEGNRLPGKVTDFTGHVTRAGEGNRLPGAYGATIQQGEQKQQHNVFSETKEVT